jgi:UDP:flavonoid glycosyltransferase YjiC (YdhE family)
LGLTRYPDRRLRILFGFVGGQGHFDPLVPVARAAEAVGHQVAFTSGRSMADVVATAGFTVLSTDPGGPPPGPPQRRPLLPVDMRREERDLRERFARDGARDRAAGMLRRAGEWTPDLIVCDEVDFGSVIAAERLGLPYATVTVLPAGGLIRPDVVAADLDEVRAEYGLPPDPELAALSRYLVLAPGPPSLRDPDFPLPATARGVGVALPAQSGTSAAGEPPWPVTRPGRPAVYVTLGTIFNVESGDLFDRVLEGVRDHAGDVVVTVGEHLDPAEFGRQPENVHIERYIPQARILPYVEVVVSHGGSGSVLGALAHGLPMVLIAMGADQPLNGVRCAALGAARVLDPIASTPEDIGAAIDVVYEEAGYRQAAMRLRDEMARLPGPGRAVELLERLARDRQPILA